MIAPRPQRGTNLPPLLEQWGEAQPSPLASALALRLAQGMPVYDFVQANPQEHGFEYPQDVLRHTLARAAQRGRWYRPDSKGQLPAREAVAAYHGSVLPEQVVLTPGTSMAYWYCFRLLARPGGEVLCPAPSYPLFNDLALLAGLRTRSYHLARDAAGHWRLDPAEIEFQLTPQTCAIVLVSPHNPTGMVANEAELAELSHLCARCHLPLIFDEVFREFLHTVERVPRPSEFEAPLCVTLNGLSKMLSLPGLKAGWMVIEGLDAHLVQRFVAALDYMADTFLPVNEVVQAALPDLLSSASLAVARNFAAGYRQRMQLLLNEWAREGFAQPSPEGGVYLPIMLPEEKQDDEAVALELLTRSGIYCHAGSSYTMPSPALITTCVPRPPWPVRQIAELLKAF